MGPAKNLFNIKSYDDLILNRPEMAYLRMDSKTAEEALLLNEGNRPVRKSLIRYLSDQILNGEWRNDHPAPVIFNKASRFIDGQHRMLAFIEANVSINDGLMVRVETGADNNLRKYLDTGITRSLADRIDFDGSVKINRFITQLINYHFFYKAKTSKKPSPEEAITFFNNHEDSLLFVAKNKKSGKSIGLIAVAYAAMEYFERDKVKAELFYPAIAIPDTLIQQARMLTYWLLSHGNYERGNKGASLTKSIYSYAVGCMKAHKEGREVKVVRAAEW
jgi:hypothetical protein